MINLKKLFKARGNITQDSLAWIRYLNDNPQTLKSVRYLVPFEASNPELFPLDKLVWTSNSVTHATFFLTPEETIKVKVVFYEKDCLSRPWPKYSFSLPFDSYKELPEFAQEFIEHQAYLAALSEINKEDEEAKQLRVKNKIEQLFGGD